MKTSPKRSAGRTEVVWGFVVASFANLSRCSSWINSGCILLFESVIRGGPIPSYFIMNFCYDGLSIEETIWMLFEADTLFCHILNDGLASLSYLWLCATTLLVLRHVFLSDDEGV
jgi:hypothetical protein